MVRRRNLPQDYDKTPITPPEDYWAMFLLAQGFPPIKPESEEISPEERKAVVDPMFQKFLYYASQYGAPGSISEFRKLPPDQKAYYLRAYRQWLKIIKKRGLYKELAQQPL